MSTSFDINKLHTKIAGNAAWKGVAVFLTHSAHTWMEKTQFDATVERHHCLHKFLDYLRPQHVVLEFLCIGWDYFVYRVLGSRRMFPCGPYTSVTQCCLAEPPENGERRSLEEGRCCLVMELISSSGQRMILASERKLNNRTQRTWRSIIVEQLLEASVTFVRSTAMEWLLHRFPILHEHFLLFVPFIFAYSVGLAVALKLANHYLLQRMWRRLQGTPQLVQNTRQNKEPPLPLSSYQEFAVASWTEIVFHLEDCRREFSRIDLPHNQRVGYLIEVEKVKGYIAAVTTERTIVRAHSKFVLDKRDVTVTQLTLVDPETKVCVDCKEDFTNEHLGHSVTLLGCGHVLCKVCDPSYKVGCCLTCAKSLEVMSVPQRDEVTKLQEARTKKVATRSISRAWVPVSMKYSSWQDVAHFAADRGFVTKKTIAEEGETVWYTQRPILDDTWREWWLDLFVALWGLNPVSECYLCAMPLLL